MPETEIPKMRALESFECQLEQSSGGAMRVIVTGEVAAKDDAYPNVQVQLKTGGDTKVVCHVDSYRYGDKVKVGQPLTAVGEYMYLKEPKANETGLLICQLVTGAK